MACSAVLPASPKPDRNVCTIGSIVQDPTRFNDPSPPQPHPTQGTRTADPEGPPPKSGLYNIYTTVKKAPAAYFGPPPRTPPPPPHDECLDHEQPWLANHPAGNYMPKANNRNTRTRSEICSKLTIKTPERRQWHYSGIFIANPEHIPHPAPVPPLLTRSR